MDPYKVLGVSPSATQEEIRAAYMALVKKYHPDRYQDSDLKKQAEDKMKQINAAYDLLTKKPSGSGGYSQSSGGYSQGQSSGGYSQGSYGGYGTGGYGGYGTGYGPFGGFGSWGSYGSSGSRQQSSYSGGYAAEFARARSFINAGRISEAEAVLNAVPLRNAEWHFLYGMCRYRSGEYAKAYEHINRACQMDPDNAEYRSALSSLRGAGASGRTWTAQGSDISCCGLCASALCANMMCNLCCRGH